MIAIVYLYKSVRRTSLNFKTTFQGNSIDTVLTVSIYKVYVYTVSHTYNVFIIITSKYKCTRKFYVFLKL